MTVSITTLWSVNTAAHIFAWGLEIASALGLPVSTWRTGDPTRSLYKYLAEVLAAHDSVVSVWIKAGFLSAAVADANESGDSRWLKVLAYELYGVEVPEASYATPTVTLTNAGGGNFPKEIGEITVQSTETGKTFRNTNAPAPLLAGATVTYELVADEAGAASSVAVDEIDYVVTTMLGVEIDSSTASYVSDEMTPDEIGELCRDSLGALSPNGPPDAYAYVCKTAELTGVTEVTRATAVGESTTGDVTVTVASASGAVSSESVAACQLAVDRWSRPLTIEATVYSAAVYAVAVTATIVGEDVPEDFDDLIATEIAAYLATVDIGGVVYRSKLFAAIHKAVPEIESVVISAPAADITLASDEVPTPGTQTITEA